jgi:hypothetical protein
MFVNVTSYVLSINLTCYVMFVNVTSYVLSINATCYVLFEM